MHVDDQIKHYIAAQPAAKQADLNALHGLVLGLMPGCKLWFLDGKDAAGRTVSNPNIGYGVHTMTYADGKRRAFYQIGVSANTTGISVYLMGIKDKTYLADTYAKAIGQASVTGYCIKFRTLKNVDVDTLADAMRDAIEQTRA